MLIRIRGGHSGIRQYLEEGRKDGRDFSRDELDERVILAGDLALTDQVIKTMDGEGERYLHITLAFKEDQVSPETLQAITADFRAFALSAYGVDEIAFYAEAHLPRIKSYTDRTTGEPIERKPHIHVVIPKQNLLTGGHANPFGMVDLNARFVDAFQEHTNARYGLASPKDHPRDRFTDESTLIARYKGDEFKGQGRELKERLLDAMLTRDITSYAAFEQLVAEHGVVRERNAGTDRAYLNVQPEGAAKGLNLKEQVFAPAFVALPTADKQRLLAEQGESRYVAAQAATESSPVYAEALQTWHAVRAREIKYLNSGSKAFKAYQAADPEQKRATLDALQARHHHRCQEILTHAQQHPAHARPEPPPSRRHRLQRLSELDVVRFADRGEVLLPRDVPGVVEHDGAQRDHGVRRAADRPGGSGRVNPPSDSVVGQAQREQTERRAQQAAPVREMDQIKQSLSATFLLERLRQTHGVTPEKYAVTQAADGSDRIRCGERQLNVTDFVTKEMNLPWKEAASLLRAVYAQQPHRESVAPERPPRPAQDLWQTYRQTWLPAYREEREVAWNSQRSSEALRRAEARSAHQVARRGVQNDRALKPAERKASLSLLQMEKVQRDGSLRATVAGEREALKASFRNKPNELYAQFLAERAGQGDEKALRELQRRRVEAPAPPDGPTIGAGATTPHDTLLLTRWQYQVDRHGAVSYFDDQRQLMFVDQGRRLDFPADAGPRAGDRDATLDLGVRLAAEKFGGQLKINGDDDFKQRVIEAAVRGDVRVTFTDPAMQATFEAQRATAKAGRDYFEAFRHAAARPAVEPTADKSRDSDLDR
jgi:hypothetical protein